MASFVDGCDGYIGSGVAAMVAVAAGEAEKGRSHVYLSGLLGGGGERVRGRETGQSDEEGQRPDHHLLD